ncbi:MAG TPA: DedA family protein [Thermodesulfobacteriota bacterium]|nr:DedA family protein [Thermodesulfobacteriota bacterium]
MELVVHWITQHGYLGIFSLLAIGVFGIPVPDEGVLGFSGYLVYKNKLNIVPAFISAYLGSVFGITMTYGLGRIFGKGLVAKYGSTFHVTEEKLNRIHRWFNRMGRWVLLFGYFIPGMRQIAAFTAGTSKLGFPVFSLFTYTGAFLWSLAYIASGYYLGEEWIRVSTNIRHVLVACLAVLVLSLGCYLLVKRNVA